MPQPRIIDSKAGAVGVDTLRIRKGFEGAGGYLALRVTEPGGNVQRLSRKVGTQGYFCPTILQIGSNEIVIQM